MSQIFQNFLWFTPFQKFNCNGHFQKNSELRKSMFSCQDGDNLSVTKSGELLYFVATVVVIYNKAKETQRYYVKHTEDVMCMDVHLSKNIVNSLTFAKLKNPFYGIILLKEK